MVELVSAGAKIDLYLRGLKGLSILDAVEIGNFANCINQIFVDREINTSRDYSEDIFAAAEKLNIKVSWWKKHSQTYAPYSLAAGWQFLIKAENLFVIHDSLLPRYRGFNPLVSMLLNEEPRIGATLIFASAEVDKGPIVKAIATNIEYPIKLESALVKICEIYRELALFLFSKLSVKEKIDTFEQIETDASYSLWRDDLDYRINWKMSSKKIQNFINSVGMPYSGASSILNGKEVRIFDCEIVKDCKIENRSEGKIFSLIEGMPVVVCGQGLVKITSIFDASTKASILPMKTLKGRFSC